MGNTHRNVRRSGETRWFFALIAALVSMAMMFPLSALSAQADEPTHPMNIADCLPDPVAPATEKTIIKKDGTTISFTDTDNNPVDPTKVDQNTNVNLEYAWEIPNTLKDGCELKSGDYFTFKLPAGVQYQPRTGTLGDYGSYSIAADGTVTFTFNDKVETEDTISGTFGYTQKISTSTTTGENTITIPTEQGPISQEIIVNPTGGNTITKAGQLTGQNSSGNNPNGITWDVTINTNGQKLTNAVVTDPMPKAGTVSTTLKSTVVYPLTVDLNGNVTGKGAALVAGTDYTVDANGTVTFIGKYAETYQAFKIEYVSDIDTSTLPDDGGPLTFTNNATLTNGDNKYPAEATVTANYGKLLNKAFDGQDNNNGSQKYNWHINYNFGEKKLPANTKLTDTLSEGQIFSGAPTLVDESGATLPTTDYSVAYNTDKTEMTITFPNGLDKGVKISYQSQVTAPIDNATIISNDASSNGKTSGSGDHEVGQQGLSKTVSDYDYNARTVTWKFDINQARQSMKDWTLDDTVPDGLTVDYSSFKLVNKDHSDKTYTPGTDFQVTATDTGFTVEFLGDLKTQATDWYVLTYTTSFDANKLPKGSTKWTNTASATWTDTKTDESHTNDGQADFTPKTEFVNDGSKSGSYNAVNKHITWTVVANYNQRTLKNASISDPIVPGNDPIRGQQYVPDSAKLYEATINKDGSYTLGAEVTGATINYDDAAKTLSADLPEGSTKVYVLTFETSLDGTIIDQGSYSNTATYTNDGKSGDLTAQVSVPNGGSLVAKTGEQDPTDSAYARWTITVNKAQSKLKNVTVVDTPSPNQVVDDTSVVVNPNTVDAAGNFTEDTAHPLQRDKDYSVTLTTNGETGAQVLTVKFLKEISSAYTIHYRSFINSALSNDTLSNSVTATGANEKAVTQDTSVDTSVTNSSGSATGKNTNIVVTKTDSDTHSAISGAKFELYSIAKDGTSKGTLLRSGTTDADGKLNWKNIKSGKYILVEAEAPVGYVIPTDLANGKVITVDYKNADADNNVNFAETNQKGKITVTKTDDSTNPKPLSGAVFDLYRVDPEDSSKATKVGTLPATGEDGTASYSPLGTGSYYLLETKAPDGYVLDSDTKHPFDINGGQIQQKLTVSNAQKTGSVTLTKTDGDTGKVLAGATFDLYKKDGPKLKSGLVTNDNGIISVDGLKPGDYYFVETAAPAGYELNDAKLPFTIVPQVTATVATVSAANAEKTGSVTLTKTDSDTHEALAGAVFDLYKKDGTKIASDLTTGTDGTLTVNDLKPGDYYFVETAAPAGYELNTAKLPFTVELQTTVKIATVSVTNTKKSGSVVLTKTDSDTGKVLAGATFDLYKADGTVVKSGLVTNDNGIISVNGLKPGDYYFVETAAPAGYELNDTKLPFTVELQTTVTVATVSATNLEKTGSVVLTKTDGDTGKVLAGAVFDLYKADGTKVSSGLTTDAKGQISVDGLKPGDYFFVETAAPAGYELNSVKLPFTVELQTTVKVATLSATNMEKTGSVVLTKTDGDTGKVLAGAVFDLYKKDGTKIASGLTTGANGLIRVNALKPGDYYFVETAAPKGYKLNDAKLPVTVELQTSEKAGTVNAKNYKIPAKTEGNGGELSKTGAAVGGVVALFGIFALLGVALYGVKLGSSSKKER